MPFFYIFWGLLHIKAAFDGFSLGASVDPGLIRGKLNQGAWGLLFFALASIAIALIFNWKNDVKGYWINLILVSIADIGFIILVLIPGFMPVFPGILGPILWVSGAIFSSIEIRQR